MTRQRLCFRSELMAGKEAVSWSICELGPHRRGRWHRLSRPGAGEPHLWWDSLLRGNTRITGESPDAHMTVKHAMGQRSPRSRRLL